MGQEEALQAEHKPFSKPWHGQLFALTVALNEADIFKWAAFSAMLGAELKRQTHHHDDSDSYYQCWFSALISLLESQKLVTPELLSEMTSRWEDAYLNTPHGQPITLKNQDM